MTSKNHASFFGQSTAFGPTSSNQNNEGSRQDCTGGSSGIPSSQTIPSGTSGRSSNLNLSEEHNRSVSTLPGVGESEEDPFRASLVSRMDLLIKDFREDKSSHMEMLYQIFQVLHEANVSELIRKATLEQYTLYVDIIASKHKEAKQ